MYTFIYIIAIFSFSFASADANSEAVQEALNSVEEVEPAPYPVEVLEEKWTAKLERKGKYLGMLNDDGSMYVIGSHVAAKSPGDRGFAASKAIAYQKAESNAKSQIVQMMGESLTSGKSMSIMEDMIDGEDPDAKQKATKMQKASKIVDQSLDKALSYLGLSDEEIANMNEGKKKAQYEEKYSSMSRSLAAASIKGCAVVAVTEGNSGSSGYQMAVLMKYAPELRSLSAAINSGKITTVPTGKARNSLDKLRSLKPQQIMLTHGARVMYDKDGYPMVVGFGSGSYETGGRREAQNVQNAQTKARLAAITAIKQFVAEDMTVSEMSESIEKISEYADGTENVFSQEKFEQAIESKKTTLNIKGAMTLRKWKGKHPLTDENLAGTVVYWSMKNKKMAEDIKKEVNRPDEVKSAKPSGNPRKTKDGVLDDDFFDDDDF
mgnify:CR=1 FL=1